MALSLPPTDTGLLAWSVNFSTLISATPTAYGLTSAQATAYAAVSTAYSTALAACDKSIRTKGAVVTKNQAKANLKLAANQTASLINGTPSVTVSQKVTLGIPPRATPTPIPAPSAPPVLNVASMNAYTLKIKLTDSTSSAKRGKPPGVSGASVFSFIGATPPNDMGSWTFEGNTGKSSVDVVFPNTTAAGARVWLTAFWFNGRKQSGPACAPVSTILPGGSVSMAA
jgi:hypothetical protein